MQTHTIDVKSIDDHYLKLRTFSIEHWEETNLIISKTVEGFKAILKDKSSYIDHWDAKFSQEQIDRGLEIMDDLVKMNMDYPNEYNHGFINLFSDIFQHNRLGYLTPFGALDPTLRKIMCNINAKLIELYDTSCKFYFFEKTVKENAEFLAIIDRANYSLVNRGNIHNLTHEENKEVTEKEIYG